MTCEKCGGDLHKAVIYQYVGGVLTAQPGYECRCCYAMYDAKGVRLVDPPEEDGMSEPTEFNPGDGYSGPYHDPEGRGPA